MIPEIVSILMSIGRKKISQFVLRRRQRQNIDRLNRAMRRWEIRRIINRPKILWLFQRTVECHIIWNSETVADDRR